MAEPSRDTLAATGGFVVAGLAIAVSFLEWTPAVAAFGVPSLPGLLTASVPLLVFFCRRHGIIARAWSWIALGGFVGIIASAIAALLLPTMLHEPTQPVGVGVYLALMAGFLGSGLSYADMAGLSESRLRTVFVDGTGAVILAVGGLLFGYLLTYVVVGLVAPVVPAGMQSALTTVVFSLGLGVVAVWYVSRYEGGLSYFDIENLDRRDWVYVAGGLVGMFAILILGGIVSSFLGLPSSKHGLMAQAQSRPSILLPLIPLSFIAIGPSEELLNRNVVQKRLYGSYSRTGAVLVATLLFTLLHIPAYGGGATPAALFVTLVRLFLVSLVLGVVFERTRNVVVAALVHGGFNAIQFGAAYILLTTA